MMRFRHLLIVAALLSAGLFATGSVIDTAYAEEKIEKIIVSSAGGIWRESVLKNFVPCFEKRTGIKVEVMISSSSDLLNRIRANPDNPPIHVAMVSELDALRGSREGLLDKITFDKVPNLRDVPEMFYNPWNSFAVIQNFGAMGVMYNNEVIKDAPKDWKTLFENIIAGKYGKKVSGPAGTYGWGPMWIWFIASLYDGNPDTAFEKLNAMSPYVVKFWTDPVNALNMFGTREVDILFYWDGRANAFIQEGNTWATFYIPDPHAFLSAAMLVKAKGAPDIAWEYVNCALSPEAQLGHSKMVKYPIVNQKVVYPDDLKKVLTPSNRVVPPAFNDIVDQVPAWIERWNKEIRR